MDLHEYLKSERVTQGEFAARVGVTQGMVGHWLHGRCRITAEMAREIERATGGKVRRHELRPELFCDDGAERAA